MHSLYARTRNSYAYAAQRTKCVRRNLPVRRRQRHKVVRAVGPAHASRGRFATVQVPNKFRLYRVGLPTAKANLGEQKRYARFIGRRPSKSRRVVALLMPRVLSQDVMVLSMLTNISMAVLFVVPGWSAHESYVHRARALEYNSGCL